MALLVFFWGLTALDRTARRSKSLTSDKQDLCQFPLGHGGGVPPGSPVMCENLHVQHPGLPRTLGCGRQAWASLDGPRRPGAARRWRPPASPLPNCGAAAGKDAKVTLGPAQDVASAGSALSLGSAMRPCASPPPFSLSHYLSAARRCDQSRNIVSGCAIVPRSRGR